MTKRHILAIGASGMLRGLCVDFARDGQLVTAIARGKESLTSLEAEGFGRIVGISADYRDEEAFTASLLKAVKQRGQFELAVAWVREDVAALKNVVKFLCTYAPASRLFHIKGWAGAEWPSIPENPACFKFGYHQILLGSVNSVLGRRWLTHQEIVAGVKKAVLEGAASATVGERKGSGEIP